MLYLQMQQIQSQNEKMFEPNPICLLFSLKFKFCTFCVWTNDIPWIWFDWSDQCLNNNCTISTAYRSFAYFLHGSLLHIKFSRCLKTKLMCEWKAIITLHCKNKAIIKTRTLVKKAEHTDTFLMAGKPV